MKKDKNSLKSRRSYKTVFFLLTITTLIINLSHSSTLYQAKAESASTSKSITCSGVSTTYLYGFRTTEVSGKPVSLELLNSNPGGNQYITDTDSNKRYALFSKGSTCYIHTDRTGKNANQLIILVMQWDGGSGVKCKLLGIITNLGMTSCPGSNHVSLFSQIGFKTATNGAATHDAFNRISLATGLNWPRYSPIYAEINNYDLPDIDDRLVEMFLMRPMVDVYEPRSVLVLDQDALDDVNNYVSLNSFAKEIKPGGVIKRLAVDNIPGYHLEISDGSADEVEHYVQVQTTLTDSESHCMNIEFYIAKPGQFFTGERYLVEITSRGYKNLNSEVNEAYKIFNYKIEIWKQSAKFVFTVKRDNVATSTLDLPTPPAGSFVYFSLAFGGNFLYFTGPDQGRIRYYEILHVFLFGQTPRKTYQTWDEDGTLADVVRPDSSYYPNRWTKVEFIPGVNINKAGLKVVSINKIAGVYPSFLLSNTDPTTMSDRCYFISYNIVKCPGFALLSGSVEPHTADFRRYGMIATFNSNFMTSCKVGFENNKCLIPKPGYITAVDYSLSNPFYPGSFTIAEFEAMDEKMKSFFHVFENNIGTKFLASCPNACK